jgi:hypothetical protein
LSCVDDDRVTICAENVRVGGEVEIEVEFDSDPAPTKVSRKQLDQKHHYEVLLDPTFYGGISILKGLLFFGLSSSPLA